MPNKLKLTPAQMAFLSQKSGHCVDTYKPYLKVKELGLVHATVGSYGRVRWMLSPAGVQFLASLPATSLNCEEQGMSA